ncbi:MAG TPA: DUF559 domain-containing protein [Acidimicrobiia bacterium]|nr:DUF559 domain-containing protein [Acidimicrobiia bacterium]
MTARDNTDATIHSLAARTYGLIRRADLRHRGVTDAMLRTRLRRGVVDQLPGQVFRVTAVPISYSQTLLAACWHAGPGAVASHRAAAALHRIDGFRAEPIELTVARGHARDVDAILHRSSDLRRVDVTVIGGIPCTNLVRTVMDLAGVLTREQLEDVIDGLVRARRIKVSDLRRILAARRRPGRNGVQTLDAALRDRTAGTATPESVLERRFLRLIGRAALPPPRRQVVVRRPDGRGARLDFAYPHARVGIELHGAVAHASRSQRAADANRANQLLLAGWPLLVFTWDDVEHRPGYVVATVRDALVRADAA